MAVEKPAPFGVLLRQDREAAGLSQEDLAARAGLTAAAIGALERGERRRPYPRTVQLLGAALNLDEPQRAALIAAVPRRSAHPSVLTPPAMGDRSPRSGEAAARAAAGRSLAADGSPASSVGQGSAAFVGRQGELRALRAKLARAFAGQGGIAVLVGEAGIGKTYLAREFAHDARFHGAAVLWGGCFEGDWQPPYGPWVEALGPFVRGRAAEDLLEELGPLAPPLARLVPEVYVSLPDVPLPPPLNPDEERLRLYNAVSRLLLAVAAKQPVLLVLDDLHWADVDSLRLLRYLARFVEQARVLVLGAYRDPEFGLSDDHPLMGTLAMLRRDSDYEHIPIGGFSGEEVAEYLAQTAGQLLPPSLVRLIEDETRGNPFYAREVLRHLKEEARMLPRDSAWATGVSIRELGVPAGVRQVVGRRVGRLSEQTGTLLKLASGFSTAFGFDVLQALSDLPEQVLLNCIDEALQAGFIRTASPASGPASPRYEFAHAIVRHTLYEGLNRDRRARLHRRIALALEQVHSGKEWEDTAELAAQYYASAALPGASKGVVYALWTAEHARASYAYARAADFLGMARDLAAESPPRERAEILRQLAIAEAEAVQLQEAQQSVEEALAAMSAADAGPRAGAEFLVTVVRALKDGGADAAVWKSLVERGLALIGDARDLLWARLALLQDHFAAIQSGPIGGGQWLGSNLDAVAIARAEGDEEDYARTLEPLDWRTPEETEAVLALARTWSRPAAIMRALDVAGRDLLYRHGAFHEARRVYEELLATSERFGSIPGQAEALTHIATSQIAIGQLLQARETSKRAYGIVAHLGHDHRLQFVTTNLEVILAYFLEGDWSSLAETVAEYARGAAAGRSPVGLIAAAAAAFGASRAGNAAQAHALLQHVTSLAEQAVPRAYAHRMVVALAATTVWDLEATEYAATYRRLLLDLLQAGVSDPPLGPLELWVARMSTLLGDLGEAQDYFARARSKLGARGLTHLQAIVDYDEARALIRVGGRPAGARRARAVELLDAAADAFRAHEMLGWAGRAAAQKEAARAGEEHAAAMGPAGK